MQYIYNIYIIYMNSSIIHLTTNFALVLRFSLSRLLISWKDHLVYKVSGN